PTKYLASLGSSVTFSHLVLSEKTLWPISAIGLSFGPPPTRIKPVNDVWHFQSGRGSTTAASLLGSTCVLRDGDRAWPGCSSPCRPQWCFPRAGHDEPGHQQDQFRASSTGSGFGTLGRFVPCRAEPVRAIGADHFAGGVHDNGGWSRFATPGVPLRGGGA